jgi:hypothetical protein
MAVEEEKVGSWRGPCLAVNGSGLMMVIMNFKIFFSFLIKEYDILIHLVDAIKGDIRITKAINTSGRL